MHGKTSSTLEPWEPWESWELGESRESRESRELRPFVASLCGIVLLAAGPAFAGMLTVPSPATDVLSESVPTAFAPNDFRAEDYAVRWEGAPPAGVRASIETGSLEWVRVSEVLVLPRGRLVVDFEKGGSGSGSVTCAGFTQALPARIPVALISGAANACSVNVGGVRHKIEVSIHPRASGDAPRVALDPSCSRFGVSVESITPSAQPDWIYVGCRMASALSEGNRTSSLETYVFWDGVGPTIDVGGFPTAQTSASLWPLRLSADTTTVHLKGGAREIALHYSIPKNLHRGGIAVGLGGYSFTYESTTYSQHTGTAILTLYGGYTLTDSMRLVAFDATAFNTTIYSDLGAYLSTEYARIMDRRVLLSLMLGAHAIGFRADGIYHIEPGAPQGLEATVTDAFELGGEFRAGAFVYPNINGNEYYNAWIRWGRSAYFVEFNYISWQENLAEKGLFYSRSLGLTVGMPLFQFL